MNLEDLKAKFRALYKQEPVVVRAPGRINIIGEHTDYNDGYVMPAAINKAIYVCISKREDGEIHLYSKHYEQYDISFTTGIKKSQNAWANYILGVVHQVQNSAYQISGFNFYIDGDIPVGAGLSSSAAVECATAFALNHLFSLGISKIEAVLISQKAEQIFSGVNCGIMDQFASVFGKKDHALMLDCRSMEYEFIPLNLEGYKFVLLNTNVKHSLSDSAYNERRLQCEQGVLWINAHHQNVHNLRDVDLTMLEDCVKPMDTEIYKKCRYVVEENTRLLNAHQCLKLGDIEGLGKLMYETHQGLSEAYQVSCPELDFLVDFVKKSNKVLGARMMGGGFGGCTINIIRDEDIEELIQRAGQEYSGKFGFDLSAYIVETDEGTAVLY